MDIVFIRKLRVDTIIGVNDWEREIRQTVILDLELATDIRVAAASENIRDTLDYHTVSKQLGDFIAGNCFHLLETLAEQSAAFVQREFGVSWLRLRVNKPGALTYALGVGVMIERGRLSDTTD